MKLLTQLSLQFMLSDIEDEVMLSSFFIIMSCSIFLYQLI